MINSTGSSTAKPNPPGVTPPKSEEPLLFLKSSSSNSIWIDGSFLTLGVGLLEKPDIIESLLLIGLMLRDSIVANFSATATCLLVRISLNFWRFLMKARGSAWAGVRMQLAVVCMSYFFRVFTARYAQLIFLGGDVYFFSSVTVSRSPICIRNRITSSIMSM